MLKTEKRAVQVIKRLNSAKQRHFTCAASSITTASKSVRSDGLPNLIFDIDSEHTP